MPKKLKLPIQYWITQVGLVGRKTSHVVAAEPELWELLSAATMYAENYNNYGMNWMSDKVSDSIVNIRLGQCV